MAENTERELLRIEQLQVYFGNETAPVKAVDDIQFSVWEGETIGVLGESGSGKSVTAKAIMQLLKKETLQLWSGSIIWDADDTTDLMQLSSRQMEKVRGSQIAMIFQDPMSSLNPVMRCGKQVQEVFQGKEVDQSQVRLQVLNWFEKVKLPDPERIFNAYPHQLSGGQLQRVMIAMAMAGEPRLLIADEPTTALDVTVQKTILTLINELKSEVNMSIIFISHDLAVIGEVADRVVVMYQGRIVESGMTAQVMSDPQHPYTQALMACRPPLDKKVDRLPVLDNFIGQTATPPEFKTWSASEIDGRLAQLTAREPIIEISDLRTSFVVKRNFRGKAVKTVKAVDGVSFEIYPGETLGLVGESGCGKTTLGRSILGLERAARGSVRYSGREILGLEEHKIRVLRKDLQIVFQNPYASLNPRMMVGAMLQEPMKVYGIGSSAKERTERAKELLNTVGLEEAHYYRFADEFSGGQRQRIAIARALAVQPKFIICDEPVSSLDVSVQAQILNLLLDLRDRFELTYLFISHDLSVVRFISDRIAVMNRGLLEEIGPTERVFNQPERDYTRKLLAAIPGQENTLL